MPTTEIATIPLVAGSEIGQPENAAAGVLKECASTISQQEGYQDMHFGMGVENQDTLQMFIDWDSKKKHEEFMASETYKPFVERFKTIIGGEYNLMHVNFGPEGGAKRAMGAAVTEVATFYFDGAPPDNAYESATEFIESCKKASETEGAKESGWHWAYGITEEVIEREGVKGKGAVLLIGWDSRQEHMDFREKPMFKKYIHLLRQTAQKIEMHHTTFMNFAG